MFDPKRIAEELIWLQQHPAFEQRPATIVEFLGEDYLNIEARVRPGLKKVLIDIFGETVDGKTISRVRRAMVTGGIGIGKTTFASIALPYMVHWVSCLKDPQDFFNLLPGSRIAFMEMSTSEGQAKEVMFGDIKARIENSRWFVNNCQFDPDFKNQLRFPKNIWVLPGNSAETTFEGYNILAGILDEGDSHKVTQQKDYAEAGYDTIHSRIDSRFTDPETGDHKGLLIVIGQMKKANGFMAKKKAELEKDERASVTVMTIWESLGWDKFTNPDGTRQSFFYDTVRKQILPDGIAKLIENRNLMEVPTSYRKSFENNPEKALRDLAGIPPLTADPFISLVDRIDEATAAWVEMYGETSPVTESCTAPTFIKGWRASNSLPRAAHLDLAYSADGDALGLAMGHVPEVVEIDGERKPVIVFDFLLRMKAAPGTEIMLADIRRLIYMLKDDLGFRLKMVTMDGFQSTDTRQQLVKRRFEVEYVSVDKQLLPYHDLREAIYERRIKFPKYVTQVNPGDGTTLEIARKELTELTDNGKKVDHPAKGSKDVTDAMAGVVYTLMSDKRYKRGVRSTSSSVPEEDAPKPSAQQNGSLVPVPPSVPSLTSSPFGDLSSLPFTLPGLTLPGR
jgi:hypothetical protein